MASGTVETVVTRYDADGNVTGGVNPYADTMAEMLTEKPYDVTITNKNTANEETAVYTYGKDHIFVFIDV